MGINVCAVIVTYNRKKLLQECLEHVLAQKEISDKDIIVVNNASSDGTKEMLATNFPNINTICLEINTGGAGGFYTGIKQAFENGYDWIWLMDDDVIPESNSLAELLNITQLDLHSSIGFLCSKVIAENRKSMNVPSIDKRPGENIYSEWDQYLEHSIVKVRSATFVSLLLSKEAVERVGYPIKEMFIWGDDTEYTMRITNEMPAFIVGKSTVIHKRKISAPPNIMTEDDPNRIKMHFKGIRNQIYINRYYFSKKKLCLYLIMLMVNMFKSFFSYNHRFIRFQIILKAIIAGFIFNPNVEKVDRKREV